jgi:hypothetical protein
MNVTFLTTINLDEYVAKECQPLVDALELALIKCRRGRDCSYDAVERGSYMMVISKIDAALAQWKDPLCPTHDCATASELEQLAREAAGKIYENQGLGPCGVERMSAIILDFVQKASDIGYERGVEGLREWNKENSPVQELTRKEGDATCVQTTKAGSTETVTSEPIGKSAPTVQPVGAATADKHSVIDWINQNSEVVDTRRLNLLERSHEIRHSKRGWAVLMKFTNYEYDLFPTLREAIDHAIQNEH